MIDRPPAPVPVLHTIGYEGASLDDFIDTLLAAGVDTLIDVRDAPVSRKPGFSKHPLAEALTAAGIAYLHLRALGNPKPGRDAARGGDRKTYERIYRAHIGTAAGREATALAVDHARETRCCLLCFERDPARCHRAITIEAMSALAPFAVRHLFVGQAELFSG